MPCCKMEVLTHAFILTEIDSRFKWVIHSYGKRFIIMKRERVGRQMLVVPDKMYCWANEARTEFRFHRNQKDEFLEHAARCGFSDIQVTERPLYKAAKANVSLVAAWTPRPNQVPIIEHVLAPGHTKVIALQTGQGKTSTSLKCGELIGERILVLALGRYHDKWKSDVIKQYRLKPGEIMTVRGSDQLYNLMQTIDTDKCIPRVINITLGTLRSYIAEYSSPGPKPDWFVSPCRLWEKLKIGVRITDEVHQHFHANYIIDLFTHVPKAIYLSATIETDNSLTNEMSKVSFPFNTRMGGGAYIKIANVVCIRYALEKRGSIQFSGFGGSYNHGNFETSMMKKEKIKLNYFAMILTLIKEFHLPYAKPGQRLLIFAYRVDFCVELVEYLKIHLPHLSICKYTSDDATEIIEQHDITVTTLGSAGTALDIQGLLTCLLTVAVDSRQANLQALGRLRDLMSPGQTPLFLYLCCEDIPKHVAYHQRKETDIFAGKTLSYRTISYANKI